MTDGSAQGAGGAPQGGDHVVRKRRVDVNKPAVLITSDGHESSVVITDLSASGFRIETSETPLIGEHVHLRVERHGELAAQIRWALGNEAGGVFLESPAATD